ncbi:MAG: TIGR03790 family protein [Candidatus Thiodiazotropha sp. DIVDIV]
MSSVLNGRELTRTFASLWLFFNLSFSLADDTIEIQLPKHRLQADELGVVVNDKDPLSLRIGKYYIQARGIPEDNLLHVSFQPGKKNISPNQFAQIRKSLVDKTPADIQAYAITWITPYRVSCMSITSAFTFGFSTDWCSKKTCASTRHSPYYDYDGSMPFTDLSVRPTISIAAKNFDDAKTLIDRGITSDGTLPKGTAYLMSTSDKQRNVRARDYMMTRNLMQRWIDTKIVRGDALRDREDVLFYFTGKTHIDGLNTLTFLPGAIADHLTSTGGKLDGSKQMSALRWLEAGATGSYGTVVEPCNHLGKFPSPRLAIEHYSHGETLLEAYWKSVQQPGEGIFIGEPLAAPFDRITMRKSATGLIVKTRNLKPGLYQLSHAGTPIGPFKRVEILRVKPHQDRFNLAATTPGYYRLEAL